MDSTSLAERMNLFGYFETLLHSRFPQHELAVRNFARSDHAVFWRAGLPAVLVSWGYTDRPASELGAEAVIQKFDGLPEALQQIAAR